MTVAIVEETNLLANVTELYINSFLQHSQSLYPMTYQRKDLMVKTFILRIIIYIQLGKINQIIFIIEYSLIYIEFSD